MFNAAPTAAQLVDARGFIEAACDAVIASNVTQQSLQILLALHNALALQPRTFALCAGVYTNALFVLWYCCYVCCTCMLIRSLVCFIL